MNRLKSGLIIFGTMPVLLASGCFLSKAEGQLMANDIDRLRNEIASLQRQHSDFEYVEERKHERVDNRLVALENASFKRSSSAGAENDQLRQELAELRGKLEETQKDIEEIKPGTAQTQATEEAPQDKKEHFEWVKEAFAGKDFATAYSRAESFLQKYKNDKNYGADIYILKGDAAFMLAKEAPSPAVKLEWEKKALPAYDDFLKQYPKSSKVAEGLYKVAETMRAMGYGSDAKIFYEEIVKKHSKSEYAKKAKARLESSSKNKKKK